MDIYVHDQFLSVIECDLVKSIALSTGMVDSVVSGTHTGFKSKGRVSSQCWIPHSKVKSICTRIADTVGLPLEKAESLQVLRYPTGGRYNEHYDSYLLDESEKCKRLTQKGQRVKTALIYLHSVEAGGQTEFPRAGKTVEPFKGRMVMWDNVLPGTLERHPDSLHAGRPVLSGEKWVANLWFREPIPPS